MAKGVIIQGIMPRLWYTQREWDRTVGYGTVPDEYKMGEAEDNWKESYSRLQKIKDAQKECTVCGCPITQQDYDDYKLCPWCYQESITE